LKLIINNLFEKWNFTSLNRDLRWTICHNHTCICCCCYTSSVSENRFCRKCFDTRI